MAGDNSKPGIPAWQRARSTKSEEETEDGRVETTSTAAPSEEAAPADTSVPTMDEPAPASGANGSTAADLSKDSQLANMQTILEDPAVKNAPMEKKRAFFEDKGISKDVIDQLLGSNDAKFQTSDFEGFKQQQQAQTRPTTQPQPKASAPPIITYPEFLVEAHKPPPLITPGRILNTAYVAGGIAALLYGASKYLVTPMSASLADARHEFATHSQSKIDEMNERLGKLVSKAPEAKKENANETETDETESETSDPTELYHRDMGTQTTPPSSRRSSSADSTTLAAAEKKTKDMISYQSTNLDILKSHLTSMLQGTESLEQPNKDRQDSVNKLRQYLDSLLYASPGISSIWTTGDDAAATKDGNKDDAVEELKKEIRGVKGVLLSAKRFPGVAGRAGA